MFLQRLGTWCGTYRSQIVDQTHLVQSQLTAWLAISTFSIQGTDGTRGVRTGRRMSNIRLRGVRHLSDHPRSYGTTRGTLPLDSLSSFVNRKVPVSHYPLRDSKWSVLVTTYVPSDQTPRDPKNYTEDPYSLHTVYVIPLALFPVSTISGSPEVTLEGGVSHWNLTWIGWTRSQKNRYNTSLRLVGTS